MPQARAGRRPVGRPSGGDNTRDAIVEVARAEFAAHGYEGTSLRAVAQQAGVDPSTAIYFFKTKAGLYQAVVEAAIPALEPVIEALRTGLPGREVARRYLAVWSDPTIGPAMLALLRTSAGSPAASRTFADVFLSEALTGQPEQRRLGLQLACSHLIGLAMARHVGQMPDLVHASDESLAERLGGVIDMSRSWGRD